MWRSEPKWSTFFKIEIFTLKKVFFILNSSQLKQKIYNFFRKYLEVFLFIFHFSFFFHLSAVQKA